MEKLDKLLYRKNMLEYALDKGSEAIKVYGDYCNEIKKTLKENQFKSSLEKTRLKAELVKNEIAIKNYISSFKFNKREYQDYLIPELSDYTEDIKKDTPEFMDIEKKAKALAKLEIYGDTTLKPENIEHIQIIDDIKTNIDLLDDLIKATKEKINKVKDKLEKAKLSKELYEYKIHVITLEKRLINRENYYYNTFKPKFDIEIIEAQNKLNSLLEIANKYVDLNIDPKLTFLLDKYEENKNDDEKLWLFYTALKSRLEKIAKFMRRNKSQFQGKMHLADKKLFN
jgi:hypothetical protein